MTDTVGLPKAPTGWGRMPVVVRSAVVSIVAVVLIGLWQVAMMMVSVVRGEQLPQLQPVASAVLLVVCILAAVVVCAALFVLWSLFRQKRYSGVLATGFALWSAWGVPSNMTVSNVIIAVLSIAIIVFVWMPSARSFRARGSETVL